MPQPQKAGVALGTAPGLSGRPWATNGPALCWPMASNEQRSHGPADPTSRLGLDSLSRAGVTAPSREHPTGTPRKWGVSRSA